MPCVIHFVGDSVDVDALVALAPLAPCSISRRGESRNLGANPRLSKTSGITLVASEADFADFETQKSEAANFLREHAAALDKLRRLPGVDKAYIDFGIQRRDVVVQTDAFEAELVGLVAGLGLILVLSQYPISDEPA